MINPGKPGSFANNKPCLTAMATSSFPFFKISNKSAATFLSPICAIAKIAAFFTAAFLDLRAYLKIDPEAICILLLPKNRMMSDCTSGEAFFNSRRYNPAVSLFKKGPANFSASFLY